MARWVAAKNNHRGGAGRSRRREDRPSDAAAASCQLRVSALIRRARIDQALQRLAQHIQRLFEIVLGDQVPADGVVDAAAMPEVIVGEPVDQRREVARGGLLKKGGKLGPQPVVISPIHLSKQTRIETDNQIAFETQLRPIDLQDIGVAGALAFRTS